MSILDLEPNPGSGLDCREGINSSATSTWVLLFPQRWAAERGNFNYVPVLSEPRSEDHWNGRTGLVHRALIDDIADLSGCQVYACGAPVMVEAARRDFTALCGLPEEEFFSDAFTPATPSA